MNLLAPLREDERKNIPPLTPSLWRLTQELRGSNLLELETKGQPYEDKIEIDNNQRLTVSADRTVQVWDATNGKRIRTIPYYGSPHFRSNSNQLMVNNLNQHCLLFDIETGKKIHTYAVDYLLVRIQVNSDGSKLYTNAFTKGMNSKVSYWDLETSRLLASTFVRDYPMQFTLNSTEKLLVTGRRVLTLYDSKTLKRVRDITVGNCFDDNIESVTFHPTNEYLLYVSLHNRTLQIWDLCNNKCIKSVNTLHSIYSLSFNSQADTLVGPEYKKIRFWDANTLEKKHHIDHTSQFWQIRYDPSDDTRVASTSQESVVRIWDARPSAVTNW